MSKLTVVFLKDTGHVLAALTRADPPAATEPPSALVGAGFTIGPVGGASTAVTMPAAMLDAVTVDDQPGVVIDPGGFRVVEDSQGLKPPAVSGTGAPGSTVVTTISDTVGATVTVQNMPLASLTAVLVLQQVASPSPAPRIVVTTLTVGTSKVVSGGFSQNDTWDVYAFVQTLRLAVSPAVQVT